MVRIPWSRDSARKPVYSRKRKVFLPHEVLLRDIRVSYEIHSNQSHPMVIMENFQRSENSKNPETNALSNDYLDFLL